MGLDLLKAPINDVKAAAMDLEGKSTEDLKSIIAALLASVQTLESQIAADAGKLIAQASADVQQAILGVQSILQEGFADIKALFPFTISSGGK